MGVSASPVDGVERVAVAERHFDGTPLTPCSGDETGPSCTLPCVSSSPGLDNTGASSPDCGYRLYCHGDGSVYGLATVNAMLYAASPTASDPVIESRLLDWVVTHESDLGLADGLDLDGLGLKRDPNFRHSMGGLTVFRFRQRYRSIPVLPPDDLVQLVYGPEGAIQLTGRIVDGRDEYDHVAVQASASRAESSIVHHAHVRTQVPEAELVVEGPALVAMPEPQTIAWMGHVRHVGGAALARVIVDADPGAVGPVLELLSYREANVQALGNTQPIQSRVVDTREDPWLPSTQVETTLVNGEPLLGSIDGISGDVQLATESVVVLDLHDGSQNDLPMVATRVLDPNGDFLANDGGALAAQVAHHLMHGWYERIDRYLTDPVAGAKQWDSAHPVYFMPPGTPSPTPPGTFAPRMLAFIDAASSDCGSASAVACASWGGYGVASQAGLVFPEIAHQPPGAASEELTGLMTIPSINNNVFTLVHEFGHVVDLFAGPGFTIDLAPDCGGTCGFECAEDTSDEAPPLTETIAQMAGMALLLTSFESVDFDYCDTIPRFSRNGPKAWDPGSCVPGGEDISEFARVGSCSKGAPYCDKPAEQGVRLECCDPATDADCVVTAPADCPSGFQRQVPTGLCDTSPGYDTHSIMQVWWQLLNGQRCEATAPFDCESSEWPDGIEPVDVVLPAFLYSLRLNPLSYQQLFDGMATYVACSYGDLVYEEFNAVACAQGLRDCAAPAPLACETCGNGVREGNETCDGTDWALTACTDWGGYTGGTLQCDPLTCELDFSQCIEASGGSTTTAAGLDTTAGMVTPTGDSTGVAGGGGGCGCTTRNPAPANRAWLLALLAALRLGRNRRRR